MKISISMEEILGTAKKYLAAHPARTATENTHRQYQKEFHRITRGRTVQEAIARMCDTGKKATYYKRKYAMRYVLSRKIEELARRLENGPGAADAGKRTRDLDTYLKLGAGIDKLGTGSPIPPERRQRRKSKRQDLAGLPSDWRERLVAAMRTSVNYLPALVAAVSGCRPAELKAGVAVQVERDVLRIVISGAKLGEGKGQPERAIEYALPCAQRLVADLARAAEEAGGGIVISIANPNSFCSAIRYYGHQTFPLRRKTLTPYCFRHQFASDAKRCLGDKDEVSLALGHQSDRTRASYGQAQVGRAGGLVPSRVEATHEVRHARTDPRSGPGQRFG